MVRQKKQQRQRIAIAILLALSTVIGCIPMPTDIDQRVRIPGTQVMRVVMEATRYEICPLDGTYLAYSDSELLRCLETAQWIRDMQVWSELRDCDEFAVHVMDVVKLSLPGIPFGLVKYRDMGRKEVVYHLANIFVNQSLDVLVVDWKFSGSVFVPFAQTWKATLVII